MGRLFLVRHAESHSNVDRVFATRGDGFPLTELGRRQAQAVGAWLAGQGPVAAVYASPAHRAIETAEAIVRAIGARLISEPGLREIDVGDLDGRSDAEAWAIHDAVVARWWEGDLEARFPGGESYQEAFNRLTSVLGHLGARHAAEDIIAVGHGSLFCSVLPRLCRVPATPEPIWLRNTAVTVLHHADGDLRCDLWGGIAHLEVPAPQAAD